MVQLWKIPDATLRLEKPTTKIPDLDIESADDKLKTAAVNVSIVSILNMLATLHSMADANSVLNILLR